MGLNIIEKITVPAKEMSLSGDIWEIAGDPEKLGTTERYTIFAHEEYQKFLNFDYPYGMIKKQLSARGINMDKAFVLELCSGFGNISIPLLRDYTSCSLLASDLSREMLEILIREARILGLHGRLGALVCDAQRNIWKAEVADLVIGAAALHHMIDPSLMINASLHALKRNGFCILLEPMETGNAILSLLLREIINVPSLNKARYAKAKSFMQNIVNDIQARTHHADDFAGFNFWRDKNKAWKKLDDKWIFSKHYLEVIAKHNNCSVDIEPINSLTNAFSSHIKNIFVSYAGLDIDSDLPYEAVSIMKKYDETFSLDGVYDIPIEACIIFRKNSGSI